MRPDCSISWLLFSESDYQWVDTDNGFGTAEDNLRCAKCSDYLWRNLKSFGQKLKKPDNSRVLVRVVLVIDKDEFGIQIYDYDPLLTGERGLAEGVRNLLKAWAYENGLKPMSLTRLNELVA